MSKLTKGLDYDSAKEKLVEVKEDIKEHRGNLSAFLKENKLARDKDHSENSKHGKKFKTLKNKLDRATSQREELSGFIKDNKPKKERVYKYNYPEDATPEQKKAIRTQTRAKAKKAGVETDEYLSDPKKYDKLIEEKKGSKKSKKADKKKGKKDKKKKVVKKGKKKSDD